MNFYEFFSSLDPFTQLILVFGVVCIFYLIAKAVASFSNNPWNDND